MTGMHKSSSDTCGNSDEKTKACLADFCICACASNCADYTVVYGVVIYIAFHATGKFRW